MKNFLGFGSLLDAINRLIITLSTKKSAGIWFLVIILFIGGTSWFGAKLIDPTIKTKTQRVNVPGQCDWLVDQNKQLIDFITGPRSRSKKAIDSVVMMDSVKRERAGIY